MIDLKNKNIIVTGASGGIGNSIVEKLNDNGANLLSHISADDFTLSDIFIPPR